METTIGECTKPTAESESVSSELENDSENRLIVEKICCLCGQVGIYAVNYAAVYRSLGAKADRLKDC